ncbi:hypothetical protein, partial [Klebsiella quasipneumoniae]|uniref:hypothetical protein n=1 Tax=Klebsiella quasipneumoniae TaxID=1463165 RepID=UPI0027300762
FWLVLKLAKYCGETWLIWCLVPRLDKFSISCFLRLYGWKTLFISPNDYCKNPSPRNVSFSMVFNLAKLGGET